MSTVPFTPRPVWPLTVRGRPIARVVLQRDAALCPVEAELQRRGAQVTRLLVAMVFPDAALDSPTFRVLGQLYDALIVPRVDSIDAADIALAAGVPVVFDDQDLPTPGM